MTAIPSKPNPKTRLIELGARALTDGELLAVVLRLRSRTDRCDEVLAESLGLSGLLQWDLETLIKRGFDEPQAVVLAAVAELSRRQARQELDDRFLAERPQEVARYLHLRYGLPDQEVMGALYIDMMNRVIGEAEHYRGILTRISVEPRAILRRGLTLHAAGMILFHTHPCGGCPEPSMDDRRFTDRMREAGSLIGVRLVDHIVVGHDGTFMSFQSRGLLKG